MAESSLVVRRECVRASPYYQAGASRVADGARLHSATIHQPVPRKGVNDRVVIQGVGLGLAIVDAIARAHGGECTVETSAAGSTFSLLRPNANRGRGVQLPSRVPADAGAALPS